MSVVVQRTSASVMDDQAQFVPVVLPEDTVAYYAAMYYGLTPGTYSSCKSEDSKSVQVLIVSPKFFALEGSRTLVNDVCIVVVANDLAEQLANYFPKEGTNGNFPW